MAKGKKTGGRKAGVGNLVPGALKEMILQALHNKGGVTYLEAQADANPNAFMALVGRILPLQHEGTPDGAPIQTIVNHVYGDKK